MMLWPRSHMMPRDKFKANYLLFCKANGHQTWQSDELWWGKLTHNDPLIIWSHVTNWKLNIFPCISLMTTKHGRLGTYDERNPPTESHDPLTTWWYVATWQTKSVTHPLWQGLCPWKSVTYGKVNAPMKSHIPLTTSFRRHMASKLYRVPTCGEAKLIMKSHGSYHVITRGHVSIPKELAGW